MPINYNPQDAVQVLPEGDYPAVLLTVMDKTFKSGNAGQVWQFQVFDNANDRKVMITDNIVLPGATFKLRDLAIALGKKADFDAGTFQPEDYAGENVTVTLKIEKSDNYPDKNAIKKVKALATAPKAAPRQVAAPAPARTPHTTGVVKNVEPIKQAVASAAVVEGEDEIPF